MKKKDMYKVEDLLEGSIPEQLCDKLFWFASKVVESETGIDLYISNENIVAFKEVAGILGMTSINDISRLTSSKWNSGDIPVLVSSGSFLWINNKIIITQRDANTSYDPLAWTTPAGRCDDTPFNTAIRETIEEIKIQDNKKRIYIPDLSKKFVSENKDIIIYQSEITFPDKLDQTMTSIRTWFEGELIEEKKLWYYYNAQGNTLELRLPLISHIKADLYFSNPEFHTETKSIDTCYLKNMKLVPALKNLLKSMDC